MFASTLTALVEKTVTIEKKTIEIEEQGVKLRLTVVDTPGECCLLLVVKNVVRYMGRSEDVH